MVFENICQRLGHSGFDLIKVENRFVAGEG
jgi:hypothetical protein